ncbi:MAG: DUF1570 domain-containing protein [Planctomycetia bacterium]|nr:DUF1570 domain-containing protein [Planctomycetia bacterium]
MPRSSLARAHASFAPLASLGVVLLLALGMGERCDAQTKTGPTASGTAGVRKPAAPATSDGQRLHSRSQHFILHTDLAPAEAQELIDRLEYMLGIISIYWDKQPQGLIECYVVKDLKNWPDGSLPDERGRQSIASGGGVTLSLVLGNSGKSTVYAGADHGTPQHEAVHAYCATNFGTTGPTWYSEGMAEMGQYWRKGDNSVKVHDVVVDYIRKSEPKTLNSIVNGNETTGDSWQNYAWRWALCHLLATNPNYAADFRPLGLGILQQKPVSFEQTYGSMANEISFEYLFFLQHLCNGYRMDLCYWDWKRKFSGLANGPGRNVTVQAGRGWQPSGILVRKEAEYTAKATGTWKLEKAATKGVTADGNESGEGKLVGIIFNDFSLSEEFDIGADGTFTPPSDGQLHLRCKSEWSSIGDNTGAVAVKIAIK